MILILLLLGILLFLGGFLLLPTKRQRFVGGGLGFIVLVGAATLMIGNDNRHWGMHQETTTRTANIASISPSKQVNLLIYQPIRQAKKERVYVYRLSNQQKRRHTTANVKTHNQIHYRDVSQATLQTKTTRWHYNNTLWRWLFSWTGQHQTLVKRQNTFILPHSWTTLSVRQAKWLSQTVAEQEATVKAKTTKTVTAAVTAAKEAQPNLTQQQLKQIQQKATRTAQQQATQQAANGLSRLLKQAQQQPAK